MCRRRRPDGCKRVAYVLVSSHCLIHPLRTCDKGPVVTLDIDMNSYELASRCCSLERGFREAFC